MGAWRGFQREGGAESGGADPSPPCCRREPHGSALRDRAALALLGNGDTSQAGLLLG